MSRATGLRVLAFLPLMVALTGPMGTATLQNPPLDRDDPLASRSGHTASVLQTGDVILTGGNNQAETLDSVLIYSERGGWSLGPPMAIRRQEHTATVLLNGNLLVTGGCCDKNAPTTRLALNAAVLQESLEQLSASAEVLDAGLWSWALTSSMAEPRSSHTATLLPDGRVLVVGGQAPPFVGDHVIASSEVFDPETESWELAASIGVPRYRHSATLLPGGRVLVAGGADSLGIVSPSDIDVTEVYEPTTDSWYFGGHLNKPRHGHSATLLRDGGVLLMGGCCREAESSVEWWDSENLSWSERGAAPVPLGQHSATGLADGSVLVVARPSLTDFLEFPARAFLYWPHEDMWLELAPPQFVSPSHAATLLPNGSVTVTGATGPFFPAASLVAETYDPSTGQWAAVATR